MSEGNIPSVADTPTQLCSSCHWREQLPHAESNTLSCTDCNTMFENDTELMTCDGPGCDQVVCACNFNLCISTTHASAISFTLHVEVYSRNPLEVGVGIQGGCTSCVVGGWYATPIYYLIYLLKYLYLIFYIKH